VFVAALGAGLVIAIGPGRAEAQRGRGGPRRWDQEETETLAQRFHIGEDGVVTVLTSKVDIGQGARTQIAQAAAEELGSSIDSLRVVMADSAVCPDDGGTAGSRTTPATIPRVRRAAALARELLIGMAAERFGVERDAVKFANGEFFTESAEPRLTLGDLAKDQSLATRFEVSAKEGQSLRAPAEWKTLGTSVPKLQAKAVVTGAAAYPSDITRPGMVYGKVLRSPMIGGELDTVDVAAAGKIKGVQVVRDGGFVGCTSTTSWQAAKGIEALEVEDHAAAIER
jgi:CO/xanthine dehydrogenase Mo-binding subunit